MKKVFLAIDLNTTILIINLIIILAFLFKSYIVYIVRRETLPIRWAYISFFLIVVFACISNLLVYHFNIHQLIFLQFSMAVTGFLYGPIIYYYSLSIVSFPISKYLKFNFYIAIVFFIIGLGYLFIDSNTQIKILNEMKKGEHIPMVVLNFLNLFNSVFYCLLALKRLKSFKSDAVLLEDNVVLKYKWSISFVNYMFFSIFFFLIISIVVSLLFPAYQLLCELLIFPIFMFVIYSFLNIKNDLMAREIELNYFLSKIKHQNELQEQRLEISRDLHDNIGSQLTFVISSLDSLRFGINVKNYNVELKLDQIATFTKNTIVELRDTIWVMNNNDIIFEDLKIRILNFINQAQLAKETITFQFLVDDKLKYKKMTSFEWVNIYRAIQEVINNAIKHANASQIITTVSEIEDKIIIVVQDNGKGFERNVLNHQNGLINIEKRIQSIGGVLVVNSVVKKGTEVKIEISRI